MKNVAGACVDPGRLADTGSTTRGPNEGRRSEQQTSQDTRALAWRSGDSASEEVDFASEGDVIGGSCTSEGGCFLAATTTMMMCQATNTGPTIKARMDRVAVNRGARQPLCVAQLHADPDPQKSLQTLAVMAFLSGVPASKASSFKNGLQRTPVTCTYRNIHVNIVQVATID